MPRAESRRLLAGGGRFTDDIIAPGELHAAFLRSPYSHANFAITDVAAAAALEGVAAVFTAAEIDRVCKSWRCATHAFPGLVSPTQRPLAVGRASYQGEAIAMVVARSRAVAEDAAELIESDWTELPAVASIVQGLANEVKAHPELDDNIAWHTERATPDADEIFRRAALEVRERFILERKTAVTLEPRSVLADYDPGSGVLTVHVSHQSPHLLQVYLAEFLQIPLTDVRIVCPDVGGGFGMKIHVYPDEVAICAASKLLGQPVKYVADRMESMLSDVHAREHVVDARMAVDADGRIVGFDVHDMQGLGAYSVFPRSSTGEGTNALATMGAPYRFAAFRGRLDCVLQNKAMTGSYRAVGHPIAVLVTERLVDLAARARGEDPLEFRRRNFVPPDAMPYRSPTGADLFELSHLTCLEKMVALVDVQSVRTEMVAARAQGRQLGLGFASFVEFTATGPAPYGRAGLPVAAGDTALLTIEASGQIRVQASAAELGQGIRQALAQIVADAVGVAPEQVRVTTGDTSTVPHGSGAWASRGAAIAGEAAWAAGQAARQELLRIAAALLQTTADRLDVRSGRIVDREKGAERIGLADLAQTVLFRSYDLPSNLNPQLSIARSYSRELDAFLPTNGIQAALIELDTTTGLVRVLKHWVVEDCGRVINPLLVDEQIRGGVMQGIGEALYEACRYDATGQFTSGTLADYLLPMAVEAPDIVVAHVETPYSGSALGAKGAGEAGTCAAAAAVFNAVNDALAPFGASVNALPITPVSVLEALQTTSRATA